MKKKLVCPVDGDKKRELSKTVVRIVVFNVDLNLHSLKRKKK